MPLQGIVNTARSLSFYMRWQEVTAHNLANANSDAFKAERITARNPAGAEFPVPVTSTDLEQGQMRDTGRSLDVALDGPGFLVAATERGERLFRGGSLRLDAAGLLLDAHGDPVLGTQGPIVLQGNTVEIMGDGTIQVDGAPAGRLRVETVEDPHTLRKEGFGRFVPEGATVAVPEGGARLRQGSIEEANLDPLVSMVELVAIQRAYAANIDALKTMDGVLGVITNDVGKVT